MYGIWADGIVTVLLAIFTVTDLRQRSVFWPAAAAAAAAGVILRLVLRESLPACLWGSLPGLGLVLVALLGREAVGRGDGYALMACGAVLGFSKVMALLTLALMFASIWGLCLLIGRKGNGRESFAFMPFLLAAQLCVMVR